MFYDHFSGRSFFAKLGWWGWVYIQEQSAYKNRNDIIWFIWNYLIHMLIYMELFNLHVD